MESSSVERPPIWTNIRLDSAKRIVLLFFIFIMASNRASCDENYGFAGHSTNEQITAGLTPHFTQ